MKPSTHLPRTTNDANRTEARLVKGTAWIGPKNLDFDFFITQLFGQGGHTGGHCRVFQVALDLHVETKSPTRVGA